MGTSAGLAHPVFGLNICAQIKQYLDDCYAIVLRSDVERLVALPLSQSQERGDEPRVCVGK